jgi:general stress protein 26
MSEESTPAKIVDLLEDLRICMLSTETGSGDLHSRPMAVQRVEEDGTLWFFVDRSSPKVLDITRESRVNAAFADKSSWVSVAGHASIVDDADLQRELWNNMVEAWFPDGPDDPAITLLRVEADSAEYWDSPGGRLATAISLVKTKVTGAPYDSDNEAADLP